MDKIEQVEEIEYDDVVSLLIFQSTLLELSRLRLTGLTRIHLENHKKSRNVSFINILEITSFHSLVPSLNLCELVNYMRHNEIV